MINDDLLVDIGPDIVSASFEYGLSLAGVCLCLQTHPHEDHLDTGYIISRHPDYGTVVTGDLLLVGSGETLNAVDEMVRSTSEYGSIFDPGTQSALRLRPMSLAPFETCTAGNYRVTGYPANHGFDQGYLLYAIEQGNHAVFYGTDTSILSEEVWDHLQRQHTRFDVVILDHTYGIGLDSRPADHLASRDVIAHAGRFRESGLLKENGAVYATHLSHEGNLDHDELDEYAREHGYRVAFDGLRLGFED